MGILLALRGFLLSCTRSEPLIAVSAWQIFAIVLTFRSPAACSEQSIIARLRDCEIARARDCEGTGIETIRMSSREDAWIETDLEADIREITGSRPPARTRGLKPQSQTITENTLVASSREDAGIETYTNQKRN